jgi:hypothetical protein
MLTTCIYIQIYFCNNKIKYLQHSSGTDKIFETYVYSHYNMCNISIYFCNIHIQHLQHNSEILEIYYCNI